MYILDREIASDYYLIYDRTCSSGGEGSGGPKGRRR